MTRLFAFLTWMLFFSTVTAEVFIPVQSSWKYWDQDSLPAADWKLPAGNDSAWKEGKAEFGFGDGGEATLVSFGPDAQKKRITTYFRRQFTVSEPAKLTVLKLRLLRDDGAVIYFNGREVLRSNMPQGPVLPETPAVGAVGGDDESRFYDHVLASSNVVAGVNLVAVEIHQSAPASTDLSFDLELIGSTEISVNRGPYLQLGTPESMVVRWRTLGNVSSRLRFGTSHENLNRLIDHPSLTNEHIVEIKDLAPDTQYFYQIGYGKEWFARSNDFHFVTSPRKGTPKETRIWVLGDAGTANANQASVRDGYAKFTGSRRTDLWLMLGDNAYGVGTDAEYQAAVYEMYPATLRQSVLWPALGNHETYNGLPVLPYFDMFTLPTKGEAGGIPSGTENYYSFDHANIHFVVLDSMTVSRLPGSPMLTWLKKDLESTRQDWIITYWHHPPYTKGSHDSDTEIELVEMRTHVLPILEQYGADINLTGHSHCYERSFLLDGHYGLSPTLTDMMKKNAGDGKEDGKGIYKKRIGASNQGTVYSVAGSSGQAGGGMLNHPAMLVGMHTLGSVVIDVKGKRLDFRFIDNTGSVKDYFTLVKE